MNSSQQSSVHEVNPVRRPRSPKAFWIILVLTWVFCAVFLGAHSILEWNRLAVISDHWLSDANVTGYCWGKATGRSPGTPTQILPANFVDGYLWTRYAQYMHENGIWRLRWVPFDNAPDGREVHWHSGLSWLLIGQGYAYHWVYGDSVTAGIERTAPGVNILPLLASLIFFSWAAARRLGVWAGVLLAAAMLSSSVFFENFMYGNPDHHGLFDLGALGSMLLPLIAGMGWLRLPGTKPQSDQLCELYEDARQARRWFILSGMFGAYGLWVSATFEAAVLALIGAALLISNLFIIVGSRGRTAGMRFEPTLWRVWGIAGAVGSLFFYLLEYFPSHMAMRLEVNHPLYAISWLGGGELLCRLTRWQVQRTFFRTPTDVVLSIVALLAAFALPLGVLIGGPAWYTPSDPFMWRLHRYIEEFSPLWWRTEFFNPVTILQVFGVFPLLSLVAIGLCCWRGVTRLERALLMFAVVPAVACLALAVYQGRWYQVGQVNLILLVALCGATFLALVRRAGRLWAVPVVLVAVAVSISPFPILLFVREVRAFVHREIQITFLDYIVMRDIASRLRDRYGPENLVILSSPSDSLPMSYFSGGKAIGTLYWENLRGLQAAAAMYSSSNDEEVREMMRRHGVTHFITVSRRDFVGGYYELDQGNFDEAGLKKSFAYRLFVERRIPNWLRPLPLPYLMDPQLGEHVNAAFAFEVALDQDEADCHFHLGDFYADMKRLDDAVNEWRVALRLRPDRLDVLPRLVRALLLKGETQQATRLVASLTQKADPEKLAPIRVAIGGYLAGAGAIPQAIDQYRQAIKAEPQNVAALNNLAWILATSKYGQFRNGTEAVSLAEKAVEMSGNENRDLLNTLAAAYAEAGCFADAVAASRSALALAEKAGDHEAVKTIQSRLELYQRGKAYRD